MTDLTNPFVRAAGLVVFLFGVLLFLAALDWAVDCIRRGRR